MRTYLKKPQDCNNSSVEDVGMHGRNQDSKPKHRESWSFAMQKKCRLNTRRRFICLVCLLYTNKKKESA